MKSEDFDELMASVQEAIEIDKGIKKPSRVFKFDSETVSDIRKKANKSQTEFADMIGVSVYTLRNWEQGTRRPNGSALALLKVVAKDPSYVENALKTSAFVG